MLFFLSIQILSNEAHAESPCRSMLAPSAVSLRDTGLDQNRVACAVGGFSLGTRGLVTSNAQNVYDTLTTSLMLDYRYLHAAGFEFSAGARLLDYRLAQHADLTEGDLDVGPISVGVLRPKNVNWWGIPVAVGHSLRFEIPYTNSRDSSLTVAASPSYLVTLAPSSKLHIHTRIAALLWSVVRASGTDSRAAVLASSDIAYAPASVFSMTTGAEVQTGWYGLDLDHVQARAGLRTALGKSGALELAAATTLAGAEQNDLVFWIGYRSITVEEPRPKQSGLRDWANQL